MPVDQKTMRLGKQAPRPDARIPAIQKLIQGGVLPPVPAHERRWESIKGWILGENDRIGDCTAVGAANFLLNITTAANQPLELTDDQIVEFYSQCSGYDPNASNADGDNPTDQGAVETDVLARWATTGIADSAGADKLAGYASVDPQNIISCKQAMHLFGGVYVGLALPVAAQAMDQVWDLPHGKSLSGDWAPGSWGGHCVPAVGYEKDGTFRVITWGEVRVVTRTFWRAYTDESYVLLSPDWMRASGTDPDGLSWDQLSIDMHAIKASCRAAIAAKAG